jgi:hypothetical protein
MRSLNVVTVVGLLALLGCGSTGDPPAPPRPVASTAAMQTCLRLTADARWRGAVTATNGVLTMDANDDYFTPTCVLAPANRELRLVVNNKGHLPHSMRVGSARTSMSVDAGQTVFASVPVGREPLQLTCTFHTEEHMVAALVPVG